VTQVDKDFEDFWNYLKRELREWRTVNYWSVAGRFRKNIFEALAEDDYVLVYPEDCSLQRIPKEDFRIVYDVWEQYLTREVKRYEIRDKTRFSSYIISIIHYLLKEGKKTS